MIAKRYRLGEREVARCLRDRPMIHVGLWMARLTRNRCGFCRVGLVLSGKVARTSVDRNFYRRHYYDRALPFLSHGAFDILVTPKKGIPVLKKCDMLQRENFEHVMGKIFQDALKYGVSLPPLRSHTSSNMKRTASVAVAPHL